MLLRIIIFLVINFGGLAIGGLFTNEGVASSWYESLAKAPWTPPGWVFGVAWSTIMICFSIYLSLLWDKLSDRKELLTLFSISWILNVIWNPLFFYFHWVEVALISIISLTVLIGIFTWHYKKIMSVNTFWILPYLIWMILATSLNLYISIMN